MKRGKRKLPGNTMQCDAMQCDAMQCDAMREWVEMGDRKRLCVCVFLFILMLFCIQANAKIVKPDVIFFDFDGTVSDNTQQLGFAFKMALKKHGFSEADLTKIIEAELKGDYYTPWEMAEKQLTKTEFIAMEKDYHQYLIAIPYSSISQSNVHDFGRHNELYHVNDELKSLNDKHAAASTCRLIEMICQYSNNHFHHLSKQHIDEADFLLRCNDFELLL
jgi:hypothetical protein